MSSIASELAADHLTMPIFGMVFKTAAEAGLNFAPILRRMELPYSAEAIAAGRVPRMSREHVVRVYRASMLALDDAVEKSEGRVAIKLEEIDMLCYCVITCRDLEEVISRAKDFVAMLNRRVELALDTKDGIARFSVNTFRQKETMPAFIHDLFGLSFFLQLFSWLIAENIPLSRVSLRHEEAVSGDLVAPLFDHSVAFRQSDNSICFPAALLKRPILRGYDELLKLRQLFPFEIMPGYLAADSLADRLHVIFKTALIKNAAFPSFAKVAKLLDQSSATLRRHLAAAGTSMSAIRHNCRREVAMDLLSQHTLTIDEISDRLGFSAPCAFRRAFKSWTGTAASAYRARNRRSLILRADSSSDVPAHSVRSS